MRETLRAEIESDPDRRGSFEKLEWGPWTWSTEAFDDALEAALHTYQESADRTDSASRARALADRANDRAERANRRAKERAEEEAERRSREVRARDAASRTF